MMGKRVWSSGRSWQWYWIPAAVFLMGIFSITLLIWVSRISERQRIDSVIIGAIKGAQINTATAHLWLEEELGGDASIDVSKTLGEIDQAVKLIDATINGGESEHGTIPESLKDPELRASAEAIRSLIVKFKGLTLERLHDPEKAGIGSVADQQFDVIFNEILFKASLLEDRIGENSGRERQKSHRLFLGILVTWGFILIAATTGLWNRERRRKTAEEALLKANEQLLETQEELVRSEKLALFGQIAGNMGNELRNPLGVMNNSVYFLKSMLPDADETVREYLEIIGSEIGNSQRIISDLLDFFRDNPLHPEVVHVRELVSRGLEGSDIPENIRLRTDIPETLPVVRVDPLQIGQVFRNLVSNGVQAMPEGGALTIRAAEDESAGELQVSVTDTGGGIAADNMRKLFQPLFTTKSRGIGLGLAISQKLTEANGGRIEVESSLGDGSTFTVVLPAGGE